MTNEQHIAIQSVEDAHAAFNKAQESRDVARKNLDEMNASLSEWRTKFDEAKRVLDASKPALTILKAQLQKADADVAIARAELAKLAPEAVSNGKGPSQSDLCAAVVRVLGSASAPLTNEAIFSALQADGVEMTGDKARSNLNAYIARWAKVPGADIVSAGRGLWTTKQSAATVPAFLAPAGEVHVSGPVDASSVPVAVEVSKAEVPAFLAPAEEAAATVLPEGFPGRDALAEAGFTTYESLAEKTHDQLRRIKGVGAQTARDILAALEA